MKTLTNLALPSCCVPSFAARPVRRLFGEWQDGLETLPGYAQRKLRLSFAPLAAERPSQLTSNKSHEHTMDSGNGNGHLPLWWIRR
jgi:hypothetical protein